jgi:hypothetical protein
MFEEMATEKERVPRLQEGIQPKQNRKIPFEHSEQQQF